MRIQHNILAMNSYRNYSNNTNALGKNLEKLSSGYKINRAGDDAAGLAISEKMRAQIQGLNAASKNVKDAISFVKTAEGAMQEIQDMLSRMKYLATQSANGTYQDEVDREALQDEVNSLLEEIDRIASAANFNGIYMLAGGGGGDDDDTTTDSVTPPTATGVGSAGLTGEGDVTVSFDDDATEEQKQALLKALTEGNGLTITATDTDGNTTPESFKIEGLPAGYTFKYMDAQSVSAEATYSDGGTLTVGTAAGNVSLTTPLVLDIYDDDGKVGSITIDTSKLEAIASGSAAVTTVTFEAADDVSKLARAEGTGDGDGDGKLLKGTTIEFDFGGKTAPVEDKYLEIGGKKYTFKDTANVGAGGEATNETYVDNGKTASSEDLDITLAALAAAIKADGVFDAEYDDSTQTLKLTTLEDYDDKNALVAALDIKGDWTDGVTVLKDDFDDATITPYDSGDGDDDTGAGGGFYEIKMQIGDSSKGYDSMEIKIQSMSTGSIGVAGLDISDIDSAHEAIDIVKEAINTVSSVRGKLGAYQNRLEHTANNLSVMTENIQDAESTIRDTDVAEEMMGYVKNNILVQSAQAMLAQANQVPQGVLQLLG